MRKPLLHIAAFVLLCLLWACGGDRALQSALDRAEALMEEHPDSALALLRPYDSIPTGSGEQRARFALLYSMALHKNYEEVESDSLIASAYTYYNEHGPERSAMLAAYYRGCLLIEAGRFDKAAVPILESLEKAEQLKDTLSMARSNELLGVLKYKNYLLDEALPYILKGATLYKTAGKTKNELATLSTAGLIFDALGRREESIQLLDSLKQQVWAMGDTVFAVELSMKLIPILLKNGNSQPEMTDKEVAALESFDYIYSDDSQTLSHLALHRLYKGDLQGCDSLLSRARFAIKSEEEKAPIFSIGAECARRSGEYKVAAELSDSMQKLQSAVVRELLKRDITLAERDYMAGQSKRAEAEKRGARSTLWFALVAFFVVGGSTAIAVIIIIQKKR